MRAGRPGGRLASDTTRILQEHLKPNSPIMKGDQGSKKISVRIPVADHLALLQFASQYAKSQCSQVLRKFIHEGLGRGPYLHGNDLDSFRTAAREVWSVGINLNQLVRAINVGKVKIISEEHGRAIINTQHAIEAIKREQTAIILRSRNRQAKDG